MTETTTPLAWEAAFLQSLAHLKAIKRAAYAAGVTTGAVYGRKKRSPAFVAAIERAMRADPFAPSGDPVRNCRGTPGTNQWQGDFLAMLAATSNVTASAAHAQISPREVYNARRKDSAFAAQWQAALCEGYRNLEMEVLGHLRDPDPARKMDVASALRLLAAHRESAAKEQAVRAYVTEAELRASIARKLDALRGQVAAERRRAEGKGAGMGAGKDGARDGAQADG